MYLCPSVPIGGTSILPLITLIYTEPRICIPRICANPCSSVGGYISPCALRRNLINLWPRLSCAFSQFSEINCLTLSLAMLARYLNSQFMNLVMRHCRYSCLYTLHPTFYLYTLRFTPKATATTPLASRLIPHSLSPIPCQRQCFDAYAAGRCRSDTK